MCHWLLPHELRRCHTGHKNTVFKNLCFAKQMNTYVSRNMFHTPHVTRQQNTTKTRCAKTLRSDCVHSYKMADWRVDRHDSDSDDELIGLALAVVARRRRRRRRRRWWVRPWLQRRLQHGAYHALLQELYVEDEGSTRNFVRMDIAHFDKLLQLVTPLLVKQETGMRQPIPPGERLAVTLRFLASGKIYVILFNALTQLKSYSFTLY